MAKAKTPITFEGQLDYVKDSNVAILWDGKPLRALTRMMRATGKKVRVAIEVQD
jgi:hypothetical protein